MKYSRSTFPVGAARSTSGATATKATYYPRGKDPGRYSYRPPPARDDGWPTATLDDVNIDRATVETLIQLLIDTRTDR